MISLFKRHTALAVLAASALVLAGCSQEDSPVVLSEGDVTLRLTVDSGLASEQSRAEEVADQNEGFENPVNDFEKVHTLRIIIVRHLTIDNDGQVVQTDNAEVEYNKLVATSTVTGMPLRDRLEFKVHDNEYKVIYLIANEAALTPPSGIAGQTASQYLDQFKRGLPFTAVSAFTSWSASMAGSNPFANGNFFKDATAIPFTEFFYVPVMRTSPGRTDADPAAREGETQNVHLFLTRAASKASFNIKVDSDYKGSGSVITGLRFSGFNWSEYVFPRKATYDPEKVIEAMPDYNTDGTIKPKERYITSFESPSRTTPGGCYIQLTGLNIPVSAGTNTTVGPVYFPESRFMQQGMFNVELQFDGETDDSGNPLWCSGTRLRTNFLTLGGFPAIARNTHIRYTLTFGEVGLTWNAIVAPYNTVSLDPIFGLNAD